MKKTALFALALAAICIISSCEKDPVNDKVVFGSSNGMSVMSYEDVPLVQQYSHTSWGYAIDLNGDGKDDVQFHSRVIYSEGGGQDICTELYCFDGIALLGDIVNQEQYLHIDSVFHTEDSIWWVVDITKTFSCERIAETDSVLDATEKFSLYANNANDSFDIDNTFISDYVILKSAYPTYSAESESGDHILYQYLIKNENNCDVFPMEEVKYIGFRIANKNKTCLGWMKVILHHDHVELLETAIQK